MKDELAARQMYQQLFTAVPNTRPQQREQMEQFCTSLVAKFPDAPTAEKANALGEAIAAAPSAE